MPTEFDTIWHEVQHADDAGVVNPCQTVKFIHDGNTFRLIVGGTYQISYAVNHHKMDAPMLVMKQVHTFTDKFQPVFTGKRSEIQRMIIFRYCCQRSPAQCLAQILVELCLGLLRVIVQNCQTFGIGGNL